MTVAITKGVCSEVLLPLEAPVMIAKQVQVFLFLILTVAGFSILFILHVASTLKTSCYEQPKDEHLCLLVAEPGTDSVPVRPSNYGLTQLLCVADLPAQLSAHPQ